MEESEPEEVGVKVVTGIFNIEIGTEVEKQGPPEVKVRKLNKEI